MSYPRLIAAKPVTLIHTADTAACGPNCAMAKTQHAGLGTQIVDFLTGLFDTSHWPARWHCGSWSDFHGWLYIASDLLIWASYFAIPLLLIRMITRRKDVPFPRIIWLFVAFIIACGTTHLLDAVIFWWPAYRLSALVKFVTAVISVFSVYAVYKVMPSILSLRSVGELEREIADRKEAEARLAQNEFMLTEAGRIGRMGSWELDIAAQKTTWSPMVYEIYGVGRDFDIDGDYNYNFYADPYKQLFNDAVNKAFATGTNWDLELLMKSGMWVRSRGECIYDEDGMLRKLRGMYMDITSFKTNEQALSKSHEMLFQSHQQLKTFTHILSHNIRNHASNIALLSSLVNPDSLDHDNGELFDKLNKVSHGLNETLNNLAEAIKIRENRIEAEKVNFRDVTGHVTDILESEILLHGVQITYDFKVQGISYPKIYMESILMNLISNAIKYRQPDGVPMVVLKTYRDDNGRAVLECGDNGLGIDLKLHGAKIFGLYKTFHNHKEAHGVGLFLVKTQVESQGGNIQVKSEPGKGTAFKIVF